MNPYENIPEHLHEYAPAISYLAELPTKNLCNLLAELDNDSPFLSPRLFQIAFDPRFAKVSHTTFVALIAHIITVRLQERVKKNTEKK